MNAIDQILTNPWWRALGYVALVAIGYAIGRAAYLIIRAEMAYRTQRRADRIAAQMRTGRELRGMR